jgi:hypothetical protein
VVISVKAGSIKKAEALKTEIDSKIGDYVTESGIAATVYVDKAVADRIDEARANGITPGKMLLINKLAEYKPEIVKADYYDATIKDIVKQIIAAKKELKATDKHDANLDKFLDETETMMEQKSNGNGNMKNNGNSNNGKGNDKNQNPSTTETDATMMNGNTSTTTMMNNTPEPATTVTTGTTPTNGNMMGNTPSPMGTYPTGMMNSGS